MNKKVVEKAYWRIFYCSAETTCERIAAGDGKNHNKKSFNLYASKYDDDDNYFCTLLRCFLEKMINSKLIDDQTHAYQHFNVILSVPSLTLFMCLMCLKTREIKQNRYFPVSSNSIFSQSLIPACAKLCQGKQWWMDTGLVWARSCWSEFESTLDISIVPK